MKKILITLPLIFIMLLSCIPFAASAKRVFDEVEDGYSEENVSSFAPSAVDFDGSYFWFSSSFVDWSQICNTSYERARFYWSYLDLDNSGVTCSEENGVFHWTWSNRAFYSFYVDYSTYNGYADRSSFNEYTFDYIKDLYYDTSSGAVWSSNDDWCINDNTEFPYAIKQQHLVIDGQDYDVDALRVHVDTGNQLSGEFTIDNTDLFSVNVSNAGNTDVQWLFAIVDSGTDVTFDFDRELSAADIVNHSSNIKYLLLRGEDCLLPAGQYESLPYTSLSQVGGVYTDYITARVQTSFHHLGAGDSDSCHIYWEMVDLKSNTQYDCVAYAMKTYSNYTSYLMSPATNNLDMADTETLTEVFRQSFTISNPKKYDSTVSLGGYGGIIANNGSTDYSAVHSDILGFTDSGGTYYDYRGTYNGVNFNSQTAGSSSKFNSLVSQSNGALKLFGSVMGYFPPELLQLIQLGFLAIVIVAIIKRVS